jgi:hypothetical protein
MAVAVADAPPDGRQSGRCGQTVEGIDLQIRRGTDDPIRIDTQQRGEIDRQRVHESPRRSRDRTTPRVSTIPVLSQHRFRTYGISDLQRRHAEFIPVSIPRTGL